MTNAPELLPCPFCGNENTKVNSFKHEKGVCIECLDCRFDCVRYWSDTPNSITEAWNRRFLEEAVELVQSSG